jgi:type I restriction enzyme, S subunit
VIFLKPKLIKLNELFEITSGGTPSRKNKAYYNIGNIPWVKTGDLKDMYLSNSSEFITELGLKESSAKLFPKGTVLIAMYGATIGNCSILAINAATNQACAAFKPTEKILPEFLYYYLISIKKRLISLGVGGAQPNISLSILKDIEIPLVSLDKQKKIVMILNKSQELINKRNAQLEALDQLTQSVFFDMFGDIRLNTKNFIETTLNEVVSNISTGKSLAGNEISQYKVLKTGAVSFKVFNPHEVKYLPIDYVPPKNHLINMGDVLVSRMNTTELVGAAGYVFDEIEDVALPDRIWKLHYNEKVNPIYLWYYINQPSFRRKVSDIATGTSGSMKNISQIKYLNIDIILPPIEVQNQFGNLVIEFRYMKKQMNDSLIQIENAFRSITQRAFKRELFNLEKIPNA